MQILVKPILTEKMTKETELKGVYGFVVNNKATKSQIKKEIEKVYNVNVTSINTMNYSGKSRSRMTKTGVLSGRTNSFKKAIVNLKKDQAIDFYSNVK